MLHSVVSARDITIFLIFLVKVFDLKVVMFVLIPVYFPVSGQNENVLSHFAALCNLIQLLIITAGKMVFHGWGMCDLSQNGTWSNIPF
jgi:hypothetical protein